jgi:hypothetical protein
MRQYGQAFCKSALEFRGERLIGAVPAVMDCEDLPEPVNVIRILRVRPGKMKILAVQIDALRRQVQVIADDKFGALRSRIGQTTSHH